MHRRTMLLIALMAIVTIVTVDVDCVAGRPDEFLVNVTSPARREGTEVHNSMLVKGTAELPPGYHIWVFARPDKNEFEGKWWPQNEGSINSSTGEWNVAAYFGSAQDIGWDFEIAVAVFDMDVHQRLRNWHTDANEKKRWEPIKMPGTAAPPQFFKVLKVGHN